MGLTFQKGDGEKIYITKLTNNDTLPLYKLSVNDILRWKGYLTGHQVTGKDDECSIGIQGGAKNYLPSDLVIPSTYNGQKVTYIHYNGFKETSIKTVFIPDSVTAIWSQAFSKCYSLEKIIIGEGVTDIAQQVFEYCRQLQKVYYRGTESEWNSINISNLYNGNDYLKNATRYYYSATKPTTEGNYWHYVDGEIIEWDGSSCENGHTWKEAPCMPKTCTVCGLEIGEAKYPNGHPFTAWEITLEPTCVQYGEQKRVCIDCGCEEKNPIDLTEHNCEEIVVEPTCSTKGYTALKCKVDGCSYEDVVSVTEMLPHKWSDWRITREPTCTEKGEQECYCVDCIEAIKTELIDMVEHEWVDATCSAPKHCKNCTATEGTTLAHVYSGVYTEPTCDTDGYMTYTCACGDTKIESRPGTAKGHDYGNDWYFDTATQMEYRICKNGCGARDERKPMFVYTKISSGANKGTYSVSAGQTLSGHIEIPSTYNGKAVTDIGEKGFKDQTGITSITIPSSIKTMGYAPFANCKFNDVYITDVNAWLELKPYATTSLPTNNTEATHILDENGKEITDLVIPDEFTTIPGYRFYRAKNIKTVTIPKSVTNIEAHAFLYSGLTKVYYGGSTEEEWKAITKEYWYLVPNHTVYYYSATEPVTEGNYWYWGDGKAYEWSAIKCFNYELLDDGTYSVTVNRSIDIPEDISIPSVHPFDSRSITAIGVGAFHKCENVVTVYIPNTVTSIGEQAFSYSPNLKNVKMSNSVTSIGNNAFYLCEALESIYIPETVETLGTQVFAYCKNLISVEIDVDSKLTTLGWRAFYNCQSLRSVNIPDSVTKIEEQTFAHCKKLESVTGFKNVESIGEYAFIECESLKTIPIPDSVTSIGSYAFAHCEVLTNLTIPSQITSINAFTFHRCSKIGEITIPNGVTSIGEEAFSHCSSLTSVVIPDSVTSIGKNAFHRCTNISVLNLPSGDVGVGVGEAAFSYCSSLTSVTIPSNIKTIAKNMFLRCIGLDSVTISYGVSEIGYAAFSQCYSLTEVEIPNSVETIETYAFAECECLTTVNIPNGTEVEDEAFRGCPELELVVSEENTAYYVENGCLVATGGRVMFANSTATIPSTASSIGVGAFYGTYAAAIKIPLSITVVESLAFKECKNLVIQVEANSKPEGWKPDWCDNSVLVIWGHDDCYYGGWTTIVQPTCTRPGTMQTTCSKCGDIQIASIPALGHTASDWIIDVEPKIETEGSKHKECTVCGKTIETESIPKLGAVELDKFKFELINSTEYSVSAADTSISGDIVIPSTYNGMRVGEISWNGFRECKNITSVTISDGIYLIGAEAFAGCTNLKKVIIPDSVKYIQEYAFYDCYNLECLVLGSGVESIGEYALPNDLNRNYIYYRGSSSDLDKVVSGGNNGLYVTTVYYYTNTPPIGNLNYWHYVNGEIVIWNVVDDSFPEYLTVSRYYDSYEVMATEGATLPQVLGIPSNYNGVPITRIADNGFRENLYLNEVILPYGLVEIGSSAFFGCDMLGYELDIPATVELIESNAFGQCGAVRTIRFYGDSNANTTILNGAFTDCNGLQELKISASVTNIDEGAFERCYGLESISVNEDNQKYYCYSNCIIERNTHKLIIGCKGSVIPSSVVSIGSGAFYLNSHQAPIKIPLSVTEIKPLAFSECEDVVIHCEASSKPSGWADDWCNDNVTVVWGVVDEDTNTYLVTESGEFLTDEQGNLLII